MEEFRYCVSCLATDVKMYSFDTSWNVSIGEIYSQLMEMPVFSQKQHMCFECMGFLRNYYDFKSKCLNAHIVLSEMKILNSGEINQQIIQNINRKLHKLESKLVHSDIQTYSCQPSLNSEDDITRIKLNHDEFKKEEPEVKIEEIITEYEEILNTSCDEIDNDETYNYSSDEILATIAKPKRKAKSPNNTEPRAKRRKKPKPDDKPLAVNENKNKKMYRLNFKFFEGYFTIANLTPEDAKQEMLLRKKTNNYKMLEFKCDMCYKGYEVKEAFDNHMDRHDIAAGEHKCDLCHLRFPERKHLRKHKLACHERKFSCILCPYACYGANQAKYHVNHHKGKKYPCEYCGERFSKKNTMMTHTRIKHLNFADETVCEFCGNAFVSPVGISLHKKLVHPQDINKKEGPECTECVVHFSSEAAWKRHLVTSSKHQVSNGCRACGATFPDAGALRAHARTHARRRVNGVKLPATCTLCDKRLTKLREYKSHMTTEHPHSDEAKRLLEDDQNRPFVCEVCGKSFKSPFYLTYHNRTHTGERPYKCNLCGKTFRMMSQLTVHTNIHTKKRLYRCEMCDSVFVQRSVLDKHMKCHLGIRPHKCTMCDKAFIHLCELKQHIKYTHEKVPWPKKKKKGNLEKNTHLLE